MSIGMGAPAHARGIIRDTEIEQIIRAQSTPIWRAAGLNPNNIQIILVNDKSLNAFVAGGQNIFIHTGLIIETETPGELLGVIAHETGHITGGHLSRNRSAAESASRQAMIATVLGIALGAASGDGAAGVAALGAGQTVAQRNFLRFTRGQESSADQAGLKYLEQTGWPTSGMADFMQKLLKQESLPDNYQSEYVRTHPLTRDRVAALREFSDKSSTRTNAMPAAFADQHARMRAKILGYLDPAAALRQYTEKVTTIPERYGRAVALYRMGSVEQALKMVDGLIAAEPKNPYFYELKGQILFENGRVTESAAAYRQANGFAPDAPLILQAYGQAVLETNDPTTAISLLKKAIAEDNDLPLAHRLLARAYGMQDNIGMAKLHTAEYGLLTGDYQAAKDQAERAATLLEAQTGQQAAALRARDILAVATTEIARKKDK